MSGQRHDDVRALTDLLVDAVEPMFVAAPDGTIVRWNAAAEDLFGVSAWQAVRRPCWSVVAGRTTSGEAVCAATCPVLREAQAGRPSPATEMVIARPSPAGRVNVVARHLVLHHLVLKDGDGRTRAMVCLVDGIDARRERERVGGRFLALMSGRGDGESLLTPREREVFGLLANGRTAREVAEQLNIRHATARNHIQRILAKLGAHNRVAALARMLVVEPPGDATFWGRGRGAHR